MSPAWSVITFVAIGWLLVNWLPHDSLHNHIGPSLDKLLAVEYGFHVTLMIAGMIVALFFVRMAVMLGTERKTTTATRAARVAEPVTR
jgi:hypothetical protein